MPASRYRDITSCLRRHADGNAYNKYYESDSPAEIMLYFQQDENNITKIIIYNFFDAPLSSSGADCERSSPLQIR
jgi:hypothetical protein